MPTALYDGNCVLCRRACAALRKLDWRRRVEFVDLHQGELWRAHLPRMRHEQLMGAIHVVDEKRGLYAGFCALRRLLKELPLALPLWLLLHLPGMDRLGALLYGCIARRRYAINRLFGVAQDGCGEECCAQPR